MTETIIESVLTGKLDPVLLVNWLNNDSLEDVSEDCVLLCCNRNEFVAHFLSYLRSQTDSILQTNSNALQVLQHQSTPEKLLSARKHQRSISDPTFEADRSMDNLTVKPDRQRSHESPSKDRKRTGRRVKTKLFTEEKRESVSSDESRLSSGIDRVSLSSTPMKNGLKLSEYPNLSFTSPVTPHSKSYERCDTPRTSHRHSRSQEKSCLGDYLVNAQKSSKKKRTSKNASDDSEILKELDLSNSDMFPEIGARKSNSLRSEKRRIKPTNIDKNKKSLSLNSFNSDCFQQSSPLALEDNVFFKQQKFHPKEMSNSFDAERNILKQERHKLMEKFNILNTETPKPSMMPQIKITHKDSFEKAQNFVKAEPNKVIFKDKLDILVEIYEVLIKNNLILSMNTEIYFLISILLSKQYEDDYLDAESKLKDNKIKNCLLKVIHNSTYFAVKSLWNQKSILEIILDKNSLKLLGENKKVRSFYPELAKFLLNSYGLKCEAENNQECRDAQETRSSDGVICFNLETDNAENFPSIMSFQNFKKQRDMFYEILRWYKDAQPSGASRPALRARVKALVAAGSSAANHAHLAALLVRHLLAHRLPPGPEPPQESKLSKLQKRLTRPATRDSHRLPAFTTDELFYKEFIECAESECFRAHLRDALASEICALDSAPLGTDASDDRPTRQANTDITQEYLQLTKKLALLAKFLGLVTSLPYAQAPIEPKGGQREHYTPALGVRESHYAVPKERVLENYLALRNYSQPMIDLKGILTSSYDNSRLIVTIPWLAQYLSMLDYTSLRVKYYQELLKILFDIYVNKLKMTSTNLKKNTVIFLKSVLGWLFSLPHFPQELFYEKSYLKSSVDSDGGIDSGDVVDELVISELCPGLRDVNVLLATCRVSQDSKEASSFRHITPINLGLNPEERMRNKEKELQARLEEEWVKSLAASTRRVLELVTERVCAACLRDLARQLAAARLSAAARAAALARAAAPASAGLQPSHEALLQALEAMYTEQLHQLRTTALEGASRQAGARCAAALEALLPVSPAHGPLAALAARHCRNKLAKWVGDNWNSTAVLCKDIEGEMKTLLTLGELAPAGTVAGPSGAAKRSPPPAPVLSPAPLTFRASAAAALIDLKEQICLVLEWSPTPELGAVLARCAAACAPDNALCRAPAQRALLQLSLDLCLVCVSRRPREVTEAFLNQLHTIWDTCCPDRRRREPTLEDLLPDRRPDLSPQLRNFEDDDRAPTPVSDEENQKDQPTSSRNISNLRISISASSVGPSIKTPTTPIDVVDDSDVLLEYFERVLCPRNIVLLCSGCQSVEVWDALANVLVFMLKNDYLSEDSLTEQCLAVYRQDWPQSTLERLARCMRAVSSAWSRAAAGKFTLFLDFLAEYCGDMDVQPIVD